MDDCNGFVSLERCVSTVREGRMLAYGRLACIVS